MKSDSIDQAELERQTVRLTERYVSEVVLAFNLCPWAAPALRAGCVQISVITDLFGQSQLGAAARLCDERLLATSAEIELVLLVLPRLDVDRLEMDQLLSLVRAEMAQREGVASFAVAAFHPRAEPDTASGERFIPFLRRSPDPLVQAVRFSSLAGLDPKLSGGTTFFDPGLLDAGSLEIGLLAPGAGDSGGAGPASTGESLRARIARRNLHHVLEQGLEQLEARLDDIIDDRNRTHRLLGLRD